MTAEFEERFIACGGYGEVYELVGHKPPAVIKYWKCGNEKMKLTFEKECNLLRRLSHANIVTLIGTRGDVDALGKFGIIMEYCHRGSLNDVIFNPKIVYTMKTVVLWSIQLFDALSYMFEKKNVIHRDIKPDNVLVTASFDVKFGDFGLGREVKEKQTCSGSFLGTDRYMSPPQIEVTMGGSEQHSRELQLSHRNDVYSLGLVTWEMIERRLVFTGLPELFDRGFNRDTLLLAIMQKIFLRLPPPQCQREVQLVVEKCTNFDRCHRPKASEVLEELRKIEMFCSYIKYFDFSPKIDEVQMKIVKPFTSCDSSTISDPDNSLEDSLSPPKVHLEDREIDFLSPPINASFLVLSEVKEVDLQKSVDNNGDADGDLEISVTEKDPLNGETALEIEERKKSHICFFGSIFVFLLVALLFFYISSFAFSEKKQIEEPNSDLLIHSNGTGKNPLYASNTYFDRPKELPEKLSDLFVKNVDTVCLKLDSYRPMESADFEPTFSVEIKFDDIDLVFSIYNGTTYLYANGEHQRNISTREAWQLWNLVEAPELLELNLNFVMGSEIKKTYQQTVALVRKLLGNAIFLPQMKTVPRLMFSANRSEILEIFLNNFHANVTEKATLEISVGMEEENSFKSQMIALMGVLSTCRIIELNGNLLERWDVLANSNALLTIQTESSMSNYLSTVSRLLLDGPPSKNPNSVAILRFYFPIPKNVHVEKAFLARTLEIENSLKKTSASLITNETTATRLYAQFFQNGFDAEIEKIRKEATQYKKMQIFLVKLGDEQDLVIFVETLNLLRGGKQWHFACQILGKFK